MIPLAWTLAEQQLPIKLGDDLLRLDYLAQGTKHLSVLLRSNFRQSSSEFGPFDDVNDFRLSHQRILDGIGTAYAVCEFPSHRDLVKYVD